ncbi:MAG: protein-L-isoaspartate(D-aspartate) O-methyltransferase [Limnochordia bacterium]|jgi:protein-L-isoaspartate(D-aspartate) O-methyltransferase
MQDDAYGRDRQRLVSFLQKRGIVDPKVIEAMQTVPRHEFVPEEYRHLSYEDRPLPIGYGQTISQPSVIGLMTQLLELSRKDRVLEIGTGSGYQTAILGLLADRVCSLEIVEVLSMRARETFVRIGYKNIEARIGDGYCGWSEGGPFDAICVTAAPDHIPRPLLDQLREGGRLVIPVGRSPASQTLWRVLRKDNGFTKEKHGAVAFVPLVCPLTE